MRVANLTLSDIFAKAGLMARETLTVNSRFAASFTTPTMNGSFFEWRDPAGNATSTAGNFPANYPNTWLRLNRVGNTFTGFASYDGQVWTQLGSDTISMPTQIYLGFCVSSRSATNVAAAQFRDITSVTNAVVGIVINPHDAIGPVVAQNADCVFGNHVEARAAHGRKKSGISWNSIIPIRGSRTSAATKSPART